MSAPEMAIQAFDPAAYLDTIRHTYRQGYINYTGRRDSDQQIIATLLSEEADAFISGASHVVPRIEGTNTEEIAQHITHSLDTEHADKFTDMSAAFGQLYVAIGIASQRMARDGVSIDTGRSVKSLIDLPDSERHAVLEQLFGDFQDLNALRFGAQGSGVPYRIFTGEYDAVGDYIYKTVDKDHLGQASLERRLFAIAYRETFGSQDEVIGLPVVHIAGKMNPLEYRQLRREFPEIPKNTFDQVTASRRDAQQVLEHDYSR